MLVAAVADAAEGELPPSAQLHIVTTPPGAAISIDGVLVGLSPRSETLRPGVHTLTAELSGANRSLTISLAAGEERKVVVALALPQTPRPAPVVGLVTFAGGALSFGLGLLLQLPARAASREVSLLFERGGGWDDQAEQLEQGGLSAQGWSWFFTGAGAAVMASGLIVTALELFGARPDLPALTFVPLQGGGAFSWGARW